MRINEIIGEWMIMPQSIKPMGLIRKPGGGFDFKNKGNNRANEKAPPGREKQVKALKGKVDNPYAVAWASYNKSKNKTNEAPIEQDHNNPIAKPYVDMPEWKALHDMDDKIIDAYIKHKEVKEADEFAPARALGEAEHYLEYSYKMAIAHLEGRHDEANIKAGVIKERIPALVDKIKKLYKTNEDQASDRAQHSIWRKNNPIGSNFMNPTDYDSEARGTHIIMDNPTELHMYKVPAENYDQAFDKWLDGKNSENPRDHEFYDSTKDYASDHQYWGRIEPAQDPMNWPNEPDEDDDDWTDADEKEFGTAQKGEDAAGVGIITKQNTTQDVKPGETQRQAKKLHLR